MDGSKASKTALVIGATGVSGRALVEHLTRQPDWRVIAASRTRPYFETTADFAAVDLMDAAGAARAIGALADVTHVFYTAYLDRPTVAETREPNTAMFANALAGLAALPRLEHVCLLQGTKYYGQYLGPFKTPAKERDGRIGVPHFYYDQEDLLVAASAQGGFSWSAVRPHIICGISIGNPLNMVSTIAAYAAIRRELGLPLTFPGKPGAFTALYQATDAGLLARAMTWMATTPACAGEAFNITNGDFFRYQNLWPRFAADFGMEAGGVETQDLVAEMEPKAALWDAMVAKYALKPIPLGQLAGWRFANYAFANDWDVMSDTTKCRRYGFLEFIDSEEMFLGYFARLREMKVIP